MDTCLLVILNFPQGLGTTTIGAAHSLYEIFSKIRQACNLSSFFPTASFNARGTGRGLKNVGIASTFTESQMFHPPKHLSK